MKLKNIFLVGIVFAASSLGASAATVLATDDFTIDGQVQNGNCPFGVGPCILLANNGPNSTAELTFSGGMFDLSSFTFSLQGTGSQVTATSNLGGEFVSIPLQGNNTDNTTDLSPLLGFSGITSVLFANTGNGTVRIGSLSGEVQVPTVPLPASGLMLLGALGLGFAARRKTA